MDSFHIYLYGPSKGPIESSFEDAEARLSQLPQLYFEPDGSFVWALDQGREQLFGMIYDAAGQIQYIELRGTCRLATFEHLVAAANGGKSAECVVQRLPDQQLQELQGFVAKHWKDESGRGEKSPKAEK